MNQFKEFWSELSTKEKVKYILIALASFIAIVFFFQNLDVVQIQLFNLGFKIPLVILIIVSMAFGYALSLMINYKKIHGLKKKNVELNKKIENQKSQDIKISENLPSEEE